MSRPGGVVIPSCPEMPDRNKGDVLRVSNGETRKGFGSAVETMNGLSSISGSERGAIRSTA